MRKVPRQQPEGDAIVWEEGVSIRPDKSIESWLRRYIRGFQDGDTRLQQHIVRMTMLVTEVFQIRSCVETKYPRALVQVQDVVVST